MKSRPCQVMHNRPLKLASLALLSVLSTCTADAPVFARDDGRYENVDPVRRKFFRDLKIVQPDGRIISCCDVSDCVVIEEDAWRQDPDGSHWARTLDGVWLKIPDENIVPVPPVDKNPVKAPVFCYKLITSEGPRNPRDENIPEGPHGYAVYCLLPIRTLY